MSACPLLLLALVLTAAKAATAAPMVSLPLAGHAFDIHSPGAHIAAKYRLQGSGELVPGLPCPRSIQFAAPHELSSKEVDDLAYQMYFGNDPDEEAADADVGPVPEGETGVFAMSPDDWVVDNSECASVNGTHWPLDRMTGQWVLDGSVGSAGDADSSLAVRFFECGDTVYPMSFGHFIENEGGVARFDWFVYTVPDWEANYNLSDIASIAANNMFAGDVATTTKNVCRYSMNGAGGQLEGDDGNVTASPTAASLDAASDTADASDEPVSASPEVSFSCFPANAQVELEAGTVKQMADVEVGDRVKVSSDRFSEVFMFTHRQRSGLYNFVTLHISGLPLPLQLSDGHYLSVNGELKAAGRVRAGDVVMLGGGSTSTVTGVSRRTERGLFNPKTVDGDIVVNGVLASTFTTALAPAATHALLSPLRHLFWSTRGAWGDVSFGILEGGLTLDTIGATLRGYMLRMISRT